MKNRLINWLAAAAVILLLSACGGGGGGESSGGAIGSTATGRIADSGQTQCYYVFSLYPEAFTCMGTDGQDGDYTISAMSFTDKGDGTILDNVTGLTWQKCSLGEGGSSCSAGAPASYTWSAANNQCAQLGTGWRLPTVFELTGILNFGLSYSAIDGAAFPGTAPSRYWTSTPHPSYTTMAWLVDFAQANTWLDYQTNGNYVRCVRG